MDHHQQCDHAVCECSCNISSTAFDSIVMGETHFEITLHRLSHANIGWYSERQLLDDHGIDDWVHRTTVGVYILWHKNGYWSLHNLFHLKALYIGKGYIGHRIKNHWLTKDFLTEGIVYFTYLPMSNRCSKYIEQLVLDLYNIPHNHFENPGSATLCAYFTQEEVD